MSPRTQKGRFYSNLSSAPPSLRTSRQTSRMGEVLYVNAEATAVSAIVNGDERPRTKAKQMTNVSREEMNAKIEAVEARLETRIIQIDSKIDRVLDQLSHTSTTLRETKEEARLAKVAASGLKWNIGFIVLTAAVAVMTVVGVMYSLSFQIAAIFKQP